jgi:trk system potassium uptake protein
MNRSFLHDRLDKILARPANAIFLSFALVILTGAAVLMLPFTSRISDPTRFIDALFTSTTATCVTGLVIADTATKWSTSGQIVILLLIQIGGLGLITLATFFSSLVGKKVGIKGRIAAQEQISLLTFSGILSLIKKIIAVTLIAEVAGALLLSLRFVPEFGIRGLYMGIFHSISAFCNAGLDIMGGYRSLMAYNNDPLVLLTVAGLIIFGGIGFMVWQDIYNNRHFKNLLLHTKMVLTVTFILLISGTVFFLLSENSNPLTIGLFSFPQKLLNSFFMAVTPRTAGFNSISLGDMSDISKIFTCFLMFVGAAPGSTGGGVKVTTLGVLIAVMISQIKGRQETLVYGKKIPQPVIMKALTIVGLSLMWVITVTAVMSGIEGGKFIDILYEVTSAFGTVGLSTGMTPGLSDISKLLLIITMFLGRIGPLTFVIVMTLKGADYNTHVIHPDGKVAVG